MYLTLSEWARILNNHHQVHNSQLLIHPEEYSRKLPCCKPMSEIWTVFALYSSIVYDEILHIPKREFSVWVFFYV